MATQFNIASQKRPFWRQRWLAILLVTLFSTLIHLWAAWQLPLDADEPVYLNVASAYARGIQAGDFGQVIDYPGNREHPALVKLVYSLPYLVLDPEFGTQQELTFNRLVSAGFGVLTVLLVCLVDPLAGLLLSLHSMTIKYTSEAYLEALPMFFSLAAVLAFERVQLGGRRRWLVISAVALGAAAAGKYPYLLVLLPILTLALTGRKTRLSALVGFGALTVLVFLALNPSLWHNPFERLVDSLFFHSGYTQGIDVAWADYPWYQQITWLSRSVPWHPQVFFFPTLDFVIFWGALAGLYFEIPRRPWLAVWILAGIAVLLVWPTKWPQYTLILTAALVIPAATLIRVIAGWAFGLEDYWNYLGEMLPRPGKAFWIGLVLFLGALMFGRVGYEVQMAQGRRGWTSMVSEITPLPGNSVQSLAWLSGKQMAIGTNAGAAIWSPGEASPWGNAVTYHPENSGLPGSVVSAVVEDSQGGLWFGTNQGLSRSDGETWQTFRAADLRLPSDHILGLAADKNGGVWAGTLAGAAYWDGSGWQSFTSESTSGGLPKGAVYSLAVQDTQVGETILFGTLSGVTRLERASGSWQTDDFSALTLSTGGVVDLMIDSRGKVWAATLGAGLAHWDGTAWKFYRTSNSDIPYNTVQAVLESEPGVLWVGCGMPTEPGGVIARFDVAQDTWQIYTPNNSGNLGNEPLAMERDDNGRLWIGTATGGLQVYEESRTVSREP